MTETPINLKQRAEHVLLCAGLASRIPELIVVENEGTTLFLDKTRHYQVRMNPDDPGKWDVRYFNMNMLEMETLSGGLTMDRALMCWVLNILRTTIEAELDAAEKLNNRSDNWKN